MLQPVLGRADCGHFTIASEKEWLVSSGLGGCFAQAWSVAEVLRAWHEIGR